MNKASFFLLLLSFFLLFSCQQKAAKSPSKKSTEKLTRNKGFLMYKSRIGTLISYDGNRLLETESAFFIDSNLIVARLSPVLESSRVEVKTWDGKSYACSSFVAIDRTNDIIILHSPTNPDGGIALSPTLLDSACQVKCPTEPKNKTFGIKTGMAQVARNTQGALNYQSSMMLYKKMYGSPIFAQNQCIGMGFVSVVDYEQTGLIVPSSILLHLAKNKSSAPRPFAELKSQSSQETSLANSRIKGLMIETDCGNIRIRLYNETPAYRDNFIALVREHYYDSLLFHRVIPGFCIQSGAADTKYAQPGDVIGWRGPGYTLPAHIAPGKFHRRGSIGAPRLPDRVNRKQRSDGSQFYIVTGRRYSDGELDLISKETGYHFSAAQRAYYKTTGGAPHVDGSYTIFGEVVSGLDVADKINGVAVGSDFRPKKDVRIRRIKILQ